MTESITDAEIDSLFSTDSKLLLRAIKTFVDDAVKASVDATAEKLGTLEEDVEALMGTASLIKQSTSGRTQKLAIPADSFQVAGSDQECRSVLVVHASDNAVYMNIGAVADADDFLIPKNMVIPVPVDNCSRLNFFGTADDIIRLLWRN